MKSYGYIISGGDLNDLAIITSARYLNIFLRGRCIPILDNTLSIIWTKPILISTLAGGCSYPMSIRNYINIRNGGHFTRVDTNRTATAKVDQGQHCRYNKYIDRSTHRVRLFRFNFEILLTHVEETTRVALFDVMNLKKNQLQKTRIIYT